MTTYEQIISSIRAQCLNAGANTFFYHSVFVMNTHRDHEYPVMILAPLTTRFLDTVQEFRFSLWWIGLENHDRSNIANLQGRAIDALNLITSRLAQGEEELWTVDSGSISVFSDRFADICAGAMADLVITMPFNECGEIVPKPKPCPPLGKIIKNNCI